MQGCSRWATGNGVALVLGSTGAAYRGLQHCASAWGCPVCGAKIRTHRAAELATGLRAHLDAGGGALFVTLTVAHGLGDSLEHVFSLVADGFRSLLSGRRRYELREDFAVIHTVRAVEVTHSRGNGWHPHVHAIFLTFRPLSAREAVKFRRRVFGQWRDFVARRSPEHTPDRRGFDCQVIRPDDAGRVGSYCSKISDAAMEITRADLKNRGKTRHPFYLLSHCADGEAWAIRAWQEYERATLGRQFLTFSAGLRRYFSGIAEISEVAATDAEIVGDDQGDADDQVLAQFTGDEWRRIVRAGIVSQLLDAAEHSGRPGVCVLVALALRRAHHPPAA